jgi:hypothetical protein
MGKTDWDVVTNYTDVVTTTLKTVTFPKVQEQVYLRNQGNANFTYTIGSQSGTLTPGQSVTVNQDVSSYSVQAVSGTHTFELRAKEKGTEITETDSVAGTVKKVNGTAPDSDGNVTLPIPQVDTTNLATKSDIQSISKGSPSGVYATLTALQTTFPTGNSNIYLVSADGKWYYWSGSAWTAGGMYQSTGLGDGSVTFNALDSTLRSNLTLAKSVTSRNLIDSSVYSGVLFSSKFYDSNNKTASFTLDKSIVLSTTLNYRCDVYFSDGTMADTDVTIQYMQGATIIATTNIQNRKVIGVSAGVVDTVQFLFGGTARPLYASKNITGFALYSNTAPEDVLTTFQAIAFVYKINDLEQAKTDINTNKTDIAGLKAGTSINNGVIKPKHTTFVDILNFMDIAKTYQDMTLVTGVLTSSVGSKVIEIPVLPSTKYYITRFSDAGGVSGMYDNNMNFLGNLASLPGFTWNVELTMPSNCYYVRFVLGSAYTSSIYWGYTSNYGSFLSGYKGKLNGIVPSSGITNQIDVFLPSEIYCAVGTTIEIYNKQVCLQSDEYHIQWDCSIGRSMKRKFVIEGIQGLIGNYTLNLKIYDDSLNVIWSGSTTVKIVDNSITNNYTYCALGDSLTSLKMWLAEVQRLSAGKLTQIGRIPFSLKNPIDNITYTGQCDGRGGFSGASYLAATTSNDSAAGGINEGVHAFWNPSTSRFDWNYYKTTLGVNPSFVQIFLGTNGAAIDPTTNANNIKQIIDYIRQDDPNIPIYMVYTLYRGNQDGIGKQGNNQGYSASGNDFKYNEDKKTFNLMVRLNSLLSSYSNLRFIPVSITHDSENNFGAVSTPVNPRASQTELLPIESVHPQTQGYLQMADIMFSTFAGTLT